MASYELSVFTDWLFEMWAMQYWRVAAFMLILWVIYLIIKNACLVDVGWTVNHFIVGTGLFALYADTGSYKMYIFYTLLACWALRLGGYLLFTRVLKSHKDPRYEGMIENQKLKAIFFFFNYQMQGFLSIICATPLYFSFRRPDFHNIASIVIGSTMIVVGIIGEAIADYQLHLSKKKRKEGSPKPEIFQEGLWRKSRHPNLFFELVTWFGFAVTGINNNGIEALGFLGPIILWAIMNFITIPVSEKHMYKTRPNYPDFVKKTNKFIPL